MNNRCVIIGSGLGGLSSALILARNGYHVTVLEQSNQIGGCLQCFQRDNVKFETGMHMVGSLDEGQVLSHYLNYLGIKDKVAFSRLNPDAYDTIKLHGQFFSFPNGHEAFINYIGSLFPKEKDNLVEYWRLVDQMAEATPFYHLTGTRKMSNSDIYLSTHSINEVLDATINDELLKDVLMGPISLYAARRNRTPFASHAFITDFYNRSAFRIVGGSDTLADILVKEIVRLGGTVRVNSKVTKACCDNGKLQSVVLSTGEVVEGDLFISDVHPAVMADFFSNGGLRPAYLHRLKSIENTISVFTLFLKFRPNTVPYLNTNYHACLNGSPWDLEDYDDDLWPRGYLYMHRCHTQDPRFAESGVVFSYMKSEELNRWSNTSVGNRGEDYKEFKQEKAAKLLSIVEKDFPGLAANVEKQYTATPLTYRDYTLTPGGSMYGMAKDITLGIAGRVTYRTKLPNLFLVGQNIKAHGILGVLVGVVDACSSILGEELVKRQMLESNAPQTPTPPIFHQPSILIMGGGISGLVCGALLTKEGRKVIVLEKNKIPGGGLQCFSRNGVSFPTGMHFSGGFHPWEPLYKIFNYLGILDKLHLVGDNKSPFDEVVSLHDNLHYHLPRGRKAYTDYLCKHFPHEKEGILAYIDTLYHLVDQVDLYHFRPTTNNPFDNNNDLYCPADKLISRYIHDPILQKILSYLIPLYAGVANETPALFHALINTAQIDGAFQFNGGSQHLANLLVDIIQRSGGKVICDEEVVSYSIVNHHITQVISSKGNTYTADTYVSDIPINELLRISPEGAFTPSYYKRISAAPVSYSSFKVFLRVKTHDIPFTHSTTFASKGEGNVWTPFEGGENKWPNLLMYIAHPDKDERFVQTITLVSPMPYDWVRQWENSNVGHRGQSYLNWKQQKIQLMMDFLKRLDSNIYENVEIVDAASPLTFRDYTGSKEGAMFGLHRDGNNIMQSYLPVQTKIKNLFLTGQDVNAHGLCGASLAAIKTAETILPDSSLRTRISRWASLTMLFFAFLCGFSSSAIAQHNPPTASDHAQRFPLWNDSLGSHVQQATITPYLTNSSSTAVIIFPGGSYFWLGSSGEGDDVARWLQQQGINAFVVRYRVAGWWAWFSHKRIFVRGKQHPDMFDDGQQALRWVRSHASQFGINPHKIGMMGFSAGGHLVSLQACYGDTLCPAFVAAVYPVVTMADRSVHQRSRRGLLGEHRSYRASLCDSLSVEQHIPRNCPPFFVVACDDDPVVDIRNSFLLDSALSVNHIPHFFYHSKTGGHGFGVSESKGSPDSRPWKDRFILWLKELNFF